MTVHNVTEMLVRELLQDFFVKTNRLPCACEHCQDDIVALALNGLPTRYASSDIGEAYYKTQVLSSQVQSDIIRELTLAAGIVAKRPHHDASHEEQAAATEEAAAVTTEVAAAEASTKGDFAKDES